MNKPLVSIIIPTKNSAKFLERCLQSIIDQTYTHIELIVIDNFSSDNTEGIASRFTKHFYSRGPERSAQVNFGVSKARGKYIYKVDSDFVLDSTVIEQCVLAVSKGYDAVVIHNSPDVTVGWIAKIRKFEVDMYKYNLTHSSARFIKREVYNDLHGFNVNITAGEDYDFQNRLNRAGYKTGFVEPEATHLGEPTSLLSHLWKYYTYGKDFINYHDANKGEASTQLAFIRGVYLANFPKFILHPVLGSSFILYNIAKYSAGGLGFASSKARTQLHSLRNYQAENKANAYNSRLLKNSESNNFNEKLK